MIYVAMCLLCIVAIESFILLPVLKPVKKLVVISQKSAKVLSSSRISDHWKEIALQRYSRDMALASLSIAFGLLLVLILVAAASYALDALLNTNIPVLEYALTGEGLLLALVFSTVYVFLRQRLVSS
jgi:cytochrome c biogenesis protein CcdA